MTFFPTKFAQALLPIVLICLITSCAKDTDFLVNAVLNDPTREIQQNTSSKDSESSDSESNEDDTTSDAELVSKTFTFNSINDAYIQDDQGYDGNLMRLQEGRRTSYMMFDLSGLEGNITNATLQFTVDSDGGDGTIRVLKGKTNDWSENDLSLANAPETDLELATSNKTYATGSIQKIELSASDLVSENLTIILTHENGNDLAFASKEHPAGIGPKLIVTYLTSPDSQDPMAYTEGEVQNTQEPASNQQANHAVDVDYYVTPDGSAYNDGLTEQSAWSLQHAFAKAQAGDNVYVKAGNYGTQGYVIENSGSAGNPISFIGYTNIPGDIYTDNGPSITYEEYKNNAHAPYFSSMPAIKGNPSMNMGQGVGLKIAESYIVLSNFQIANFKDNIVVTGSGNELNNVISLMAGDHNPSHTFPTNTSDSHLNYSGTGMQVSGDNNTILNSLVINAGAEGFVFSGDYIIHKNNKVFSDTDVNPTDYYYLLVNAHHNNLDKIHVERVGDLYHKGHGITLKVNAKNNLIDNSVVINTSLELSYDNVSQNTVSNCYVGNYDSNVGRGKIGSILIANGAHHNTIKNCTVNLTSESGLKFMDWKDGSGNPGDAANAGNNNIFENCTISNSEYGIDFNSDWNHDSTPVHDNEFISCTFNNLNYLFRVDRYNFNNTISGASIENIENYKYEKSPGKHQLNITLDNIVSYNLGFSLPN